MLPKNRVQITLVILELPSGKTGLVILECGFKIPAMVLKISLTYVTLYRPLYTFHSRITLGPQPHELSVLL